MAFAQEVINLMDRTLSGTRRAAGTHRRHAPEPALTPQCKIAPRPPADQPPRFPPQIVEDAVQCIEALAQARGTDEIVG